MYVTEAKLRSNLYLTDLPPGGCSQASALWAVRRRRKRGGGPVSKALCGAAPTAERYCELWAGGPLGRQANPPGGSVGGSSRPPCDGSRIHA